MYIYAKSGNNSVLVSLDNGNGIALRDKNIKLLNVKSPVYICSSNDPRELDARMDDIKEALKNDVKVYDATEPVGYWKPKTRAKPGPKPKSE